MSSCKHLRQRELPLIWLSDPYTKRGFSPCPLTSGYGLYSTLITAWKTMSFLKTIPKYLLAPVWNGSVSVWMGLFCCFHRSLQCLSLLCLIFWQHSHQKIAITSILHLSPSPNSLIFWFDPFCVGAGWALVQFRLYLVVLPSTWTTVDVAHTGMWRCKPLDWRGHQSTAGGAVGGALNWP